MEIEMSLMLKAKALIESIDKCIQTEPVLILPRDWSRLSDQAIQCELLQPMVELGNNYRIEQAVDGIQTQVHFDAASPSTLDLTERTGTLSTNVIKVEPLLLSDKSPQRDNEDGTDREDMHVDLFEGELEGYDVEDSVSDHETEPTGDLKQEKPWEIPTVETDTSTARKQLDPKPTAKNVQEESTSQRSTIEVNTTPTKRTSKRKVTPTYKAVKKEETWQSSTSEFNTRSSKRQWQDESASENTDTDNTENKCCICSEIFTRPSQLRAHLNQKHRYEKPFECSTCRKTFKLPSALHNHALSHKGLSNFICEICGMPFRQESSLKKHKNSNHSSKLEGENERNMCKICYEIFPTGKKLGEHKILEHVDKEKIRKCTKCDKLFSREINYEQHVKDCTQGPPYECTDCGKVFSDPVYLKKHQKLHGAKQFTCAVCNKTFSTANYLTRHMLIHSNTKPTPSHVCSLCGKSEASGYKLNLHMMLHSGQKPFSCSVCQKQFRLKRQLQDHERIHTGETPYQCAICDKKFATHDRLRQHQATHQEARKYKCTACGKSYKHARVLAQHMNLHTGKKRHECQFCQKTFSQKHELVTHSMIHLGLKPYTCCICGMQFRKKYSLTLHERKHHPKLDSSQVPEAETVVVLYYQGDQELVLDEKEEITLEVPLEMQQE